ncbi:MAG: SRPBCC family protein [Acidobacteriia bacterium]|nr:SRPBCC family protein [Terriglobia bacterium]
MSNNKTSRWMLLGGLGAAAAAVYFADPKRGAQRRANFARGAGNLFEKAKAEGERSIRDLQNQLAGISARLRSHFELGEVSDRVVEERVRSRIGRIASHARRIRVLCDHGVVTLWGPVFNEEVPELLHAVNGLPGVREVRDHLEPFASDDPNSPLAKEPVHHDDPLRHARKQARLNWSPTKRMMIGAAGAGLALYGMTRKEKGAAEKALTALGASMFVSSTMRNNLAATLALSEETPGFEIERTIKINAPISDLYDFWANPENYPRVLSHVARIDRLGENLYRWTLDGPAGVPVGWEGVITRAIPNTLVEWKSLPGSSIGNFGIVRFHPDYDATTRVNIRMFYRPPAGILGRFLADLLGADAGDILDQDLNNLKAIFESGNYISEERRKKREQAELLRTATT